MPKRRTPTGGQDTPAAARQAKAGQAPQAYLFTIETAVVLAMLIALHPLAINPDAAMHLSAGQMLLEGKRPYVDVIDTNPPLIFYLNVIPAFIAQVLSANAIVVFSITVLVLVLASAWSVRLVVRGSQLEYDQSELALLLFAWVAFAALTKYSELYITKLVGLFGQREHIFMLLYLPLFVVRWVRWHGGRVRTGLAAAMGVGDVFDDGVEFSFFSSKD